MSRVIWKGSISFGLVHIPVSLYSGEQRAELSFTMLDKRDLSPVGYKRYNKTSGKDVAWEDIVKGYEYEKDQYVVLGEEEFRRANVRATQTVEILEFVKPHEIPITYYDRPYYLEPLPKGGPKGYALLREALVRTNRVGIAKVVLRNREHLAVLAPLGNMLVLNLLRFAHELRDPEEFKIPGEDLTELRITKKEVEMAERLVEDMSTKWKPQGYRDEYREDILRVVEEKVSAGKTTELEAPREEHRPRGAQVIDFMTLLKRSVEENEKSRPARSAKARPRRKRASAKKRGRKRA